MPDKKPYPLYFDAKKEYKDVFINLTEEQQEKRLQHQEIINAMDDYYNPYRERWRQNGALFNVIQRGTDDPVSNRYLGWARMLINHSLAMTSAGEPEGSFIPPGPSDERLKILWNALVKHYLNKSFWKSQQRKWLLDMHITGNGVIKAYNEMVVRKDDGQMIRDRSKSKVGLRTRSPFKCMRSIWIADPDDVRIGVEREAMSWNQAINKYGNVKITDGKQVKNKYDFSQVPLGYNCEFTHVYDEDSNEYTIYCLTWGGKAEEKTRTWYQSDTKQLGALVFTQKLKKSKLHDEGLNIRGQAPLSFSQFESQLDVDYETHSICGMGIPQIIEGPEEIMQQLVNQTITNVELKNTVPVSYEPLDPQNPSYLDVDASQLRSAVLIDGKVTPQPLGIADVGSNTILWEWLKQLMYQLTGINPEGVTGHDLNTAFQSGLVVRQMNLRAGDRIKSWEQGCLKRAWGQLLDYSLSDSTIKDWKEITEKDADEIVQLIADDDMTGEDFKKEDKKKRTPPKKRNLRYFPVQGYNFRESFKGKNKKVRSLQRKSASNTLVGKKGKKTDVSFVPMDDAYLIPSGDLEDIIEYDVHVSGKSMLFDLKTQDSQTARELLTLGAQLKPAIPRIDLEKQYINTAKISDIEEDEIMTDEQQKSKLAENLESIFGGQSPQEPTVSVAQEAGGSQPAQTQALEDLANANV